MLAGAKANRDNRALRRLLVHNTTEMMRWLEGYGLILEGHGHHLGWAFISGRIAGRHAAMNVDAVITGNA